MSVIIPSVTSITPQGGSAIKGAVTLVPGTGITYSQSGQNLTINGTSSSYNAAAVAITGGTIDGVTIGATTPVQAQGYRPINAQTGTTYTFVLGDAGKWVSFNNVSAITVTVPTNASVAYTTGTEIELAQLGAGQVTVAAAGGVTINGYNNLLHLAGQYAGATLKKYGTDSWLLVGNLA